MEGVKEKKEEKRGRKKLNKMKMWREMWEGGGKARSGGVRKEKKCPGKREFTVRMSKERKKREK